MEEQIKPVMLLVSEGLQSLGYSPTDSLVLTHFLLYPKDVTAQQIERTTWLRQPQVSLSINSLIDKKHIVKSSVIPGAIGRAVTTYDLRGNPDQACEKIRDAILNEMDLKMKMINKLEVLIHVGANEDVLGDIQNSPP